MVLYRKNHIWYNSRRKEYNYILFVILYLLEGDENVKIYKNARARE